MDFISDKTMEVTKLALDGLAQRHNVLSSNVANAQTAGYKRSDVQFESQLKDILKVEHLKDNIKAYNSTGMTLSPQTLETVSGSIISSNSKSADAILKHNAYESYNPEVVMNNEPAITANGNNVNIEKEMTELMKNGTKYTILAELQGKMFMKIQEIIKGAQ